VLLVCMRVRAVWIYDICMLSVCGLWIYDIGIW